MFFDGIVETIGAFIFYMTKEDGYETKAFC